MNETIPPFSGYPAQSKTSGLAISSLVLGILGLVLLLFCVGPLFAIPGVICGHMAHSRIKRSAGALTGQGLAVAGLVTGYIGIACALVMIPMMLSIAIPNFVKARNTSMMNACLNHLRQIDAAKTQWALEKGKKTGDIPTAQDLTPYFKNGVFPICPAGGTYTIGAIGNDPICSIAGHTLSQPRAGDAENGSTPNNNAVQVAATPQAAVAPDVAGVFIPAPYRADMVHDPKRNILYISAGDSVLRYQMDSNTFLSPLVLGGDLRGIDIAPDNDRLAVADATDKNGSIGIYLVDLKTGTNTRVTFRAENLEGGTYSVAFGADGGAWITSTFHGSGSVPLRKYDPLTRHVIVTQRIRQDTMLAASGNREFIAYAEADISSGDYGRFRCRATQLQPPLQANAFLYEIGISRDGTQLAVPTGNGVMLSGSAVQKIDEKETLGVAYHPQRDFIFLARAGISTIAVYETTTYTMVKELDFGDKFGWVGNRAFKQGRLRLSSDGKFIFCTVQGGVRCAETGL